MSEKAYRWMKQGNKSIRVFKLAALMSVLCFGLQFISKRSHISELLLCMSLYVAFILWRKLSSTIKLKKADVQAIDVMSHSEFVRTMLLYFSEVGWKAKRTKEHEDIGGYFLLFPPDKRKLLVQIEPTSDSVEVPSIQKLVAAITYFKAHGAMLITNRYLTHNAEALARANHVEVWHRGNLAEHLVRGTSNRIIEN